MRHEQASNSGQPADGVVAERDPYGVFTERDPYGVVAERYPAP